MPWSNVNTDAVAEQPVIASAESTSETSVEEEGDAMDYFKRLAED